MGIPRIVIRNEDIKSNGEVLVYIRYIYKNRKIFISTNALVDVGALLYQKGVCIQINAE